MFIKCVLLLAKSYLNTIDALTSKDLIDLYISHDEFISVNNVLLSSKCAVWDSKKSKFIKTQKAEGLLSMTGKTLILVPLLI